MENYAQSLNLQSRIYFLPAIAPDEIVSLFNNDNYTINKLDICRIFRYLDRYTLEGYEG